MDELSSTIEIEAIQVHVKILEKRKQQLDDNISSIMSVIDKCKKWIEDTGNKELSFTDLIMVCLKTAADGKNVGNVQTPHASDNLKTVDDNSMVEKIMARLEVFDEAFSSILSSKKQQDKKIAEVTEQCKIVSNNLNENLNKIKIKINKNSIVMKEKINKLEQGLLKHEDMIKKVSDILEAQENSVDTMMHTQEKEMYHLQSSIDKINENNILLERKFEENESSLCLFKDLFEREKAEQQNAYEILEKKFGCSLKILMSKVQTVYGTVYAKLMEKIEHITSELQMETSKAEQKKPWLVTDWSSINRMDSVKRRHGTVQTTKESHQSFVYSIVKHNQDLIDTYHSYDKKTGIFKAPYQGLYLVYFKITNCCKQPVILAMVIRDAIDQICRFKDILLVDSANNITQSCHFIYLRECEEICLYMNTNVHAIFDYFACVMLY